MKVDKPMFKVGEYNHKVFNHQFNFPGRLVWDPVTITIVDMPDNGAQKKLYDALAVAGYGGPGDGTASAATDGLSKFAATSALGDVTITQMKANQTAGPETHLAGDTWTLRNAFLIDVKFGSLDYGSEDAVQIQMTVRYDWAQYASTPTGT